MTLGRKARDEARLKHRQPLRRLVVAGAPRAKAHADEIAEELRVREVEFGEVEASELRVKPNLPVLGPKLGGALREVREQLQRGEFTELEGGRFEVGGHVLEPEEVLVERVGVAGWSVASENGVTVALDSTLDDDLLLEGRLLDLIHTVNVLRKDSGLDVTDRIRLVAPDEDVIRIYADRLAAETLAVSVEVGELALEKAYKVGASVRERELAAQLGRQPELDVLVDEPVGLDLGDPAGSEPVADALHEPFGAEAPDVRPTTSTPSSHASSMSVSSSINWPPTPPARATSTSRFEFDEFRDPTTSRRSISAIISFTAHCRLDVA